MSDNPFGRIDKLSEAEEAEYDALDKTPLPSVLLKKFRTPASVGWVEEYVGKHSKWCPAQRMLRRLGIAALILSGCVLTLNIIGALSAKAIFKDAVREGVRAELKETVRNEVRDALKEFGVIHSQLEQLQRVGLAVVE